MNYQGDFLEDATVYIPFNTFDSNDPSASVTITNLAQGDVEVWKDGVVQTTPGSGVTLTLNIGTGNGTHLIAVDTSDETDGWFVINADYQVRITGTTIDSATVNAWVGTFSIENRFKDVNVVSEDNIDFGALKKTSLNAATTDLSAITGDKNSYKATDVNVTSEANIDFGALKKTSLNAATPDLTAIATVIGALDNAAAAGAVTEADTLMQYLKQLINILIGGPGVVTFPAEAAPGDGVSLAEVIRAIHVDVTGLNGDVMVGTNNANIVEPDATGTAAGLHTTTDAKIDTTDGLIGGLNNVSVANLNTACDTVTVTSMANDVITAASINTGAIAADAVASTALDNVVMSDLAQGAPSATASIVTAINVLYEAFRNKTLTTATLITIKKDDGATDLMKATISDAGGTTTKEEFESG